MNTPAGKEDAASVMISKTKNNMLESDAPHANAGGLHTTPHSHIRYISKE